MEPLTRFGRMADRHWREHRPNMVRHLQKAGVYQEALSNAQERAKDLGADLVGRGADPAAAQEEAMRTHILLPSEEEQPTLPADRMPFSQPAPSIGSGRKTE
jgi:hypothetical protein